MTFETAVSHIREDMLHHQVNRDADVRSSYLSARALALACRRGCLAYGLPIVAAVNAACIMDLGVPDDLHLLCSTETDCPGSYVCVEDVGFCALPTAPCIAAQESSHVAIGDGSSCLSESGEAGTCHSGKCLGYRPTISAGDFHTCGIKRDGTVICWGLNDAGQCASPAGVFKQISGTNHNCGIGLDGTVTCWGHNQNGQCRAPPAELVQVSAGMLHTCGLLTGGRVFCWGSGLTDDACLTGGEHECGQARAPASLFSEVAAGAVHSCGVQRDGSVICWGYESFDLCAAPDEKFSHIAAGALHTCGITIQGIVLCWGRNDRRIEPPVGTFTQLSAGYAHTCAISASGSIQCWGAGEHVGECDMLTHQDCGQSMPPEGSFRDLSAGAFHTCGLHEDGSAICWGDNRYGQGDVPEDFP